MTWLEAGEQITALAADFRTFLHHDAQQARLLLTVGGGLVAES